MKKLISMKLDEGLFNKAKIVAQVSSGSLTKLVSDLLQEYVEKNENDIIREKRYENIPNTKIAIVTGAGGFIGDHLVKHLKNEGYWVRGVDLKFPEFRETAADEFFICDLRNQRDIAVQRVFVPPFESNTFEVYAMAAIMGGAGFIFTGDNDADITHNNALVNLNTAKECQLNGATKVFYSSSACVYPQYNQLDPDNPKCSEESAYPADPDSDYGIEKLFSERVFMAFNRNLNLDVRIARFHNIFGKFGSWTGGKEKAPAAICRKVAEAEDGGEIEIWGDGQQTRSFLYIDECIKGIRKLMSSNITEPLNIGSEEMVTINQLASYAMKIAEKELIINHIPGPLGVRGRNSDNKLIKQKIGWEPSYPLKEGLEITYKWIEEQVKNE